MRTISETFRKRLVPATAAGATGALALLLAVGYPASSDAQSPGGSVMSTFNTKPTITSAEQVSGTADTATVRMEWDEPDLAPIIAHLGIPRTGFCYTAEEEVDGVSQGHASHICETSDDTHVEFDVSVPPPPSAKTLKLRVRIVLKGERDGYGVVTYTGHASDEVRLLVKAVSE